MGLRVLRIRASTEPERQAARSLLRRAIRWALISAVARSRRPIRLLARPLPGLAAAGSIVPLTLVSLVVSEFPLHVAVAQLTSAASLLRRGALRHRCGVVGLAVALHAWFRLLSARRDGLRAAEVLEVSLRSALGDHYRDELPADLPAESSLSMREIGSRALPNEVGICSTKTCRTASREYGITWISGGARIFRLMRGRPSSFRSTEAPGPKGASEARVTR